MTCESEYHKDRRTKKQAEVEADASIEKECIKCNKLLALDKFTVGKNTCRTCMNKYERDRKAAYRELHPKPPVKIPVIQPVVQKPSPIDPKTAAKRLTQQIYQDTNRDKIKAQKKEYYQNNKTRAREWNQQHKEKRNERLRERRMQDRSFAATNSMRVRLANLLKGKKDTTFDNLIGCTKSELYQWLAHQFDEKMDWTNYGYIWHIDHVVPIKFFDLDHPLERQVCFHWSNLKPLMKEENLSKSGNIIFNYIMDHLKCVKTYMCDVSEYQAAYESMWWPRLELGYGNNLTDEEGSEEELLKWAIRSQAPKPAIDKGMGKVQRLDGNGLEEFSQLQ